MHKPWLNIVLLSIVLLSSGAANALLCDFHGDPRFSHFAGNQHYFDPNQRRFFSSAELSLSHETEVYSQINKSASVLIKYRVPRIYKDVSVQIYSPVTLNIQTSDKITIDNALGEFALSFIATSKGTHSIEIKVDAMKHGQPTSLLKKIDVVVI